MNIAIIAPPWVPVPPPTYGGTESVLDTLARGLVAAGHHVLLYATGDSTCPVRRRWVLERAPGTAGISTATELRHVVNAYDAAMAWGADVVHDHTLVGPIYSARFDVPVVTTNHGPFDSELGDIYRAISPTVPVIAISADHASRAVGTDLAAIIHHGVDLDRYPFGTGQGGYAAFLGRMCPDKAVHTAAKVAHAAGVPLRIAAKLREPAERDYFDAEVEPLLGDGVEYIGEIGGDDKLELLQGASCLLNPIAWPEPFGMVMIEALACGTPVVATPCGSVPELIDHGVTGFVHDDPVGLAGAVLRAATLDRAACRAAVADRFSAERMVADHVALYEKVAVDRLPVRAP